MKRSQWRWAIKWGKRTRRWNDVTLSPAYQNGDGREMAAHCLDYKLISESIKCYSLCIYIFFSSFSLLSIFFFYHTDEKKIWKNNCTHIIHINFRKMNSRKNKSQPIVYWLHWAHTHFSLYIFIYFFKQK